MSQLKNSYLKFVSNSKSYLIITTDKNVNITIATGQEKFPHLVGQSYFPKYKSLPATKFIEDIIGGQLDDYQINIMDKEFKSLVKNKIDAFKYVTKENVESAKIFTNGKSVAFGEKVVGHGVLLITLKNKKVVAVVLRKDKINIFHPISIMLLTTKSRKYLIIKKLYFEKVTDYKFKASRPKDDWPKKSTTK